MYLGRSPLHQKNVALVMDANSGRVSPQFHVKFDVKFHTILQNKSAPQWIANAGFANNMQTTKDDMPE